MKAIASLVLLITMVSVANADPQHGHWVPIGTSIFPEAAWQILAGPAETVFFVTSKNGVYNSTDAGRSWQTMNAGLPSLNISKVWISPNGTLIARTDSGWFSATFGATWYRLLNPDTAIHFGAVVAVGFDSHGTAYFGTDVQGVFRLNTDNTFTRVIDGRVLPPLSDLLFDSQDRILATLGVSLYRFNTDFSPDRSWKNVYGQFLQLPSGSTVISGDSLWLLEGNTMQAFAGHSRIPLIADSSGILYDIPTSSERSMDNGKTWSTYASNQPSDEITLAAGTTYGIITNSRTKPSTYTSRDSGSSFQEAISLSNQLTFYSIFTDKAGQLHAFDSVYEHWISNDRGVTWSRRPSYAGVLPIYGQDGRYYFTVYGQNTNVWMSNDGGVTYNEPPHPTLPGSTYYDFFAVESGNFYTYSDSGYVSKSTDEGNTWLPVGRFADRQSNGTTKVAHCTGIVEHGQHVWALTQGYIYFTSDNGDFWDWTGDHTGSGNYAGLIPGRGQTVFVYMTNIGYEWLAPMEATSYATWIECAGPLVETTDSDAIAFRPYLSAPFYRDVLIHQTHDLTERDTLLDGPDSLSITDMTLDSSGDLLGVGYPSRSIDLRSQYLRGIYKFYPEGVSDVESKPIIAAHSRLWATMEGGTIKVHSDAMFSTVMLSDILGRISLTQMGDARNECALQVDRLASGFYRIVATTKAGELSTKIVFVK